MGRLILRRNPTLLLSEWCLHLYAHMRSMVMIALKE
jgi:hypothetical protein